VTGRPFGDTRSVHEPTAHDRIAAVIRRAVPSVAPAVAVSVWVSGEPWYEGHVGWVDPPSAMQSVGPGTLFDLASLTKLFTTTAFLRLAHEGEVRLDGAVVSVIPEFGEDSPRHVDGGQEPLSRRVLPTPPGRAGWLIDPRSVTFLQLLTHTSGLAPWRSIFLHTGPPPPVPEHDDSGSPAERRARGLAAICASSFVARPGEEVHYSDLGFMLLGETVARLYGAPLDAAIRALICDPLGLESVVYTPMRTVRHRVGIAATSEDHDWRHRRCWGEVEDENAAGLGGVAGHAGLFATAQDVARFGVAWSHHDPRLGLGIFGRDAVVDHTPRLGVARGLGWQVQPADQLAPFGVVAYGHTGFTGTSLAIDPERDVVVALLTNRVHAGRMHPGIDDLRLAVHDIAASAVR
jgi:serine-type D-Ala-D-Ala carboxypeptidase